MYQRCMGSLIRCFSLPSRSKTSSFLHFLQVKFSLRYDANGCALLLAVYDFFQEGDCAVQCACASVTQLISFFPAVLQTVFAYSQSLRLFMSTGGVQPETHPPSPVSVNATAGSHKPFRAIELPPVFPSGDLYPSREVEENDRAELLRRRQRQWKRCVFALCIMVVFAGAILLIAFGREVCCTPFQYISMAHLCCACESVVSTNCSDRQSLRRSQSTCPSTHPTIVCNERTGGMSGTALLYTLKCNR